MKYIDEYQNPELAKRLIEKISLSSLKNLKFMEFCGGHTTAVMKFGLRQLLYPTVVMLSGPGCPVCVTSISDIDKTVALAKKPECIVATFGDMIKVPGSRSSLQKVRAEGGDVRVVYSPLDALDIAKKNSDKAVVLIGIGFETTAPAVAASILEAKRLKIQNYFLLSLHKLCPPVIKALLDSGDIKLDGIICPGHVSCIIGSHPYEFIPINYGIPSVIAGFEALDILLAVKMMIDQIEKGQPKVEIAYRRGVKPDGNIHALKIMNDVFDTAEVEWRGMGLIKGSGLKLKDEYKQFCAETVFSFEAKPASMPEECLCGEILRGIKTPGECKLFARGCTPDNPVGPCMVSSEGTCAAHFLYGYDDGR